MKLYIDSADKGEINRLYDYYPVDGVTTNPSILKAAGKEPYVVLEEIRRIIDSGDLFVQTVSLKAEEIIKEGEKITKRLGKDTYIKIPATQEGIKAMKALKREGFNVASTAVYTPSQAFLSAKCGVDYIAPYVNRIDNLGYNGVEEVKRMEDIIENNGLKTKIVVACFKNSFQVIELVSYGVGALTLSPLVFDTLLKDSNVLSAVNSFKKDYEDLQGEGKTMYND